MQAWHTCTKHPKKIEGESGAAPAAPVPTALQPLLSASEEDSMKLPKDKGQ